MARPGKRLALLRAAVSTTLDRASCHIAASSSVDDQCEVGVADIHRSGPQVTDQPAGCLDALFETSRCSLNWRVSLGEILALWTGSVAGPMASELLQSAPTGTALRSVLTFGSGAGIR